jgi:HEAT repeat protein
LLRSRPNVERLRRKGDARRLVEVLTYEDRVRQGDGRVIDVGAEVRRSAVEALAGLDGQLPRDGLVRALRDPEPVVRSAAVAGLHRRGYDEGAGPLTAAVTQWTDAGHAPQRMEALEALASFERSELPRRVAAELLRRHDELGEADAIVLRRLVESGGEGSLRTTIGDLVTRLQEGSGSPRVRTLLAWLAPDSVNPVLDLLDEPAAQREAALALGAIRDARATEPLCLALMGSEDAAVRAASSWALGEIRDPAAVTALMRASGDEDYDVRAEAIAAFDKLGNVAVAVAMTVQMRAALEDGAGRTIELDDVEEEEPRELDHAADPPPPEPQPAQPQQPPYGQPPYRGYPPRQPFAERARPLLRRLLGEPPAPPSPPPPPPPPPRQGE